MDDVIYDELSMRRKKDVGEECVCPGCHNPTFYLLSTGEIKCVFCAGILADTDWTNHERN